MSDRTAEHDTIVVERRFAAAPDRVFGAWVEPEGRDRWDVPGYDWEHVTDERDVRVGGRDVVRFGPPGALAFRGDTTYVDIVPDERIVSTYTVAERDALMSVSLLTVEIRPDGDDTSDVEAVIQQQMRDEDGFLVGRKTFEEMRAKYVVSRWLQDPAWENTTVLRGDAVDDVRALKQRPGGDLGVTGSITLCHALIEAGIVDEFRLFVYPVVIGRGRRLFPDGVRLDALQLVEATPFTSGVALLTYRPR